MGFGRACTPVRCTHPSFEAYRHAKRGAARPLPTPIAASLLLIRSPKIDKKKLSNSGRQRDGLFRNKMLSFRLELRPPESWVSFFPLYHRSYEIWGLLPRSPPIAALLIIPAIFWGQNYLRVLVYWCILMMYSFCNDVQFLYTYPSFWGVFRRGQAFFIFVFFFTVLYSSSSYCILLFS